MKNTTLNFNIIKTIQTLGKKNFLKTKRFIVLSTALLLLSSMPFFMGPGLDTPTPIDNYLNNAFPALSTATPEPYRVAFENLSFFYPIVFETIPNQDKLLIAQLDGKIYWFDNDETTTEKNLVVDLSNSVGITGDAGFLGLAIHPNFGNGDNFFYVYYTSKDSEGNNQPAQYTMQNCNNDEPYSNYVILERFEVDPVTLTIVDGTRTNLIKNRMNGTSHRGGGMDFGDDGFLYIVIGDQTAWSRAQDMTNNLHGGVLRIDVDKNPATSHPPTRKIPEDVGFPDEESGEEYWIPNDNPFVNEEGATFEEYYGLGLRNPFKMTKDQETGVFYIGEVGLGLHEEVNIVESGKNYGWPVFEGNANGPNCLPNLLDNMPHQGPITAFLRDDVNSLTGGYVYRGTEIPELYGKYICADYGIGDEIFTVDLQTGEYEQLGTFLPADIISFGQDEEGEVYILNANFDGPIYKMKSVEIDYSLFPQTLSETGAFSDLNTLEVNDGIIPYELVESFWSDGALKRRWMAIPNDGTHNNVNEQIEYSENGDWDFPIGTVLIKHFDLIIDENNPNNTRKIETRFSIKGENGKFYFLTYNWNDAQTDAILQSVALDEPIEITTASGGTTTQTWHFPSNSECITCHNSTNNGNLGLRTRYLNTDLTYNETNTTANQLVTLSHLGIIDETILDEDTPNLLTSKSIYDPTATLEEKARSYLDLNCAYCHRPDTDNRAGFDLRLFNSLEATELLTAAILTPLGIEDEKIVFPGDASKSILYHRTNSIDPTVMMPPLAKSKVDEDAVSMIEAWINQLDPNIDTINSPDDSVNLALLPSAEVSGSVTGGRGTPIDILWDPRINAYFNVTDFNEYGVAYNDNLGTIDVDGAFRWRVDWPAPKLINYITFGGTYPNQPQENTMWRVSYLFDGNWQILEEGQGGWINSGTYEWGGNAQNPITADAVRVELYSDGENDVVSIHLRARGGIANVRDDSDNPIKATLIQYLPPLTDCLITSISAGNQTICDESDNSFTQEIIIEYSDEPETGMLNVNGQLFPITTSPQNVTLTGLDSNGTEIDVSAFFTDDAQCISVESNLFSAPESCSVIDGPDNTQDNSINLALLNEAVLSGSINNGRGSLQEILYDPELNDYRTVTAYNEYGVGFNENLGTVDVDNGLRWQVNWPSEKYVNYITFGGAFDNQPQPNTLWRISYLMDGDWLILEEGQGGWIDDGIYEWGGDTQIPISTNAIRVQLYSDGNNDLVSIHLRGRGGNSNNIADDSDTNPKATLIQYIENSINCNLDGLEQETLVYCDGAWLNNIIPDENSIDANVYIGNGTYTINQETTIEINNLTIAEDASLVVEEGAGLIINGNLNNDGVLNLESSSTQYSSLIVKGENMGTISYARHVNSFNGVTGNDLISPPVVGQTFGNFSSTNPNLYENPDNTNQKLFGPFDEPAGTYVNYLAIENSDVMLLNGVGYRAARDIDEDVLFGNTLTFTGNVETNPVNILLTETATDFSGWNLVGNPYASYLDFEQFFIANQNQLDDGAYKAVYGYDGDATDGYTILNNLNSGSKIAPGQGFFIKVKEGGGEIDFTPDMQVTGNSDDFIEGRMNSTFIELKIDNGLNNFETSIHFIANATLGLDPGYDAALFGESAPDFALYSLLVEEHTGQPIGIQALNENSIGNVVIPLGIHVSQGETTEVSISDMNIPSGINVYLEDTFNNSFTLLNSNTYSFTSDIDLSETGRFFIRFESESLSTLSQNLDELKIYKDTTNKVLVIEGQLLHDTTFTLYDIQGRKIKTLDLDKSSTIQHIDISYLSNSIYLGQLQNDLNLKRIKKIVIE